MRLLTPEEIEYEARVACIGNPHAHGTPQIVVVAMIELMKDFGARLMARMSSQDAPK